MEFSTVIFWGFNVGEKGRFGSICFSMVSEMVWIPWNSFSKMILIITITISLSFDLVIRFNATTRSRSSFETSAVTKDGQNTVIWFGENC